MKLEIRLNEESTKNYNRYLLSFPLTGDTSLTKEMSELDLKEIMDKINELLGYKELIDVFKCSKEEAEKILKFQKIQLNCKDCKLKMVECHRCVNICESPLERDLLHNLVLMGINPELQLRISKFNEVGHYPVDVNKESILTIPDFYLENGIKKVCIYTDGHSYHERTENQAMRDRSIDRELQNFGYQVLRFTGKEIREKMDIVIATIKRSIE